MEANIYYCLVLNPNIYCKETLFNQFSWLSPESSRSSTTSKINSTLSELNARVRSLSNLGNLS